jgi:hypothetical protein
MCPRVDRRQTFPYRAMRAVQFFGSMPILSLTADRIRCLQPKYRSVVWIET